MTFAALRILLGVSGVLSLIPKAEASTLVTLNGAPCSVDTIVTRDVCIIGGGSTGTYSAIRLSDLGKTVVVVESKSRLGGHTETYTDPATKRYVDYGVVVWHDLDIVRSYFARLNVSLTKAGAEEVGNPGNTHYVDLTTGQEFLNYSATDPSPGLTAYAIQLAKYPFVEGGFDLPYPVPVDLLLPFGDFAKKYNLQSLIPLLWTFAQGLGDILAQPTLYIFKNFGYGVIRNIQIGFLTSEQRDNSLLYEHAAVELGENVLLNSNILAVDRSCPDEAKVLVQTPTGNTLIKAGKLVFTIPPKLDNLRGWDLSGLERKLFGQFSNSGYYSAIVDNSGLPENVSILNVSPEADYQLGRLPGIYKVTATTIPGLYNVKYGSVGALPDAQVREQIISDVQKIKIAGKQSTTPELAIYSSHTPFELTVPPQAIADGFYKQLYGLQGKRHTYYTGAAFHTHDSSLLWQFTEKLLPNITAF